MPNRVVQSNTRCILLSCLLLSCAAGRPRYSAPHDSNLYSLAVELVSATPGVCLVGGSLTKTIPYRDLTFLAVTPLSWSYGREVGAASYDRVLIAVEAVDGYGVARLLTVDMGRRVAPDSTDWYPTGFPTHTFGYAIRCFSARPTLSELNSLYLDNYWTLFDGSSAPGEKGRHVKVYGLDREAWQRTLGIVPPFRYPILRDD